MGRFLRLSDEELSRLLAGEAGVGDEASEQIASLLGEVRKTFATAAPDEATRALQLAAIAEAAQVAAEKGNPVVRPVSKVHGPVELQVSGLPKWKRVRDKMLGFALKAAAGTMAASMSLVGLAYAGVDLPGQAAERAFEAVTGVELPNQGSDQESSVADEVRSVLDGDLEGCELGQAVADAADANREDDATTETNPCEQDDARGSRATGEENSAAGRANAAERSEGRSETGGSAAATEGRATATENSGGASDTGADNADERSSGAQDAGADNAGTRDDSGRATADEAASDGRSTGSSTSDAGSDKARTPDDAGSTTGSDASGARQETGSSAAEEGRSNNPTGYGRP